MRLFFISCFFLCYGLTHAQLKQIPYARQKASAVVNQPPQIQSTLSAIKLPYWDDFSFNNSSKGHVNDSLWQFGHSVWVNTGMGINPPTLNVATFDGLDSLGKPYSDVALAKGYADKLVSRPLRMDLIPVAKRDTVFLSFFYQYQGNGEAPDAGDELSLWFKKDDATWIQVWSVGYDTLKDKTKFVPVTVSVKDACETCFYNDFQFRFQNFARLSGPFDTWNLDYVYLNNGVRQYAGYPFTAPMPDRAIVYPPTSVVKQYQSIPAKHLLAKGDSAFSKMEMAARSLRVDQNVTGQNVRLTAYLNTTTRLNGIVSDSTSLYEKLPSDNPHKNDPPYSGTIYGSNFFHFDSIPHLKNIDSKVDSIALTFKIYLETDDNSERKTHPDPNPPYAPVNGDYDSTVYKGIDFRVNDTIRTSFTFSNYYAYDDGEAEYAVTLTQPIDTVAYQFDMMYLQPDTLIGVDIYFPHVGDESAQSIRLFVFDDQVLNSVHKKTKIKKWQDLVVKRTENNRFVRVMLDTAQIVQNKFFVGYKQNSNAAIGIGFDKNSDSSDKMFVNLGGGWEAVNIQGNLMMRPVFGYATKVVGPITGIEEKKITFYPNPNRGSFYLSQSIENLQITDVAGRPVSFEREDYFDSIQVTLRNPSSGIYLARYFNGKQWRTEKIMVLP